MSPCDIWLCSVTRYARGHIHDSHYFESHHILWNLNIFTHAKMAENYFNFGRKWQTKKLHMSKNSSTFAAEIKNK